jgi:hypothetical protein
MNPYLRAAQQHPEIKLQAIAALENRQQEAPTELVRARNADGTFVADDPSTPDIDEAWEAI